MFLKHLQVNQRADRSNLLTKLIYIEDNIKYEVDVRDHLVQEVIKIVKKKEQIPTSTFYESIPIGVPPDKPVAAIPKPVLEEDPLSKFKNANIRGEPIIPVVVFACNRVSVRDCLDNLLKYRPNVDRFPIIVSQVSPKT